MERNVYRENMSNIFRLIRESYQKDVPFIEGATYTVKGKDNVLVVSENGEVLVPSLSEMIYGVYENLPVLSSKSRFVCEKVKDTSATFSMELGNHKIYFELPFSKRDLVVEADIAGGKFHTDPISDKEEGGEYGDGNDLNANVGKPAVPDSVGSIGSDVISGKELPKEEEKEGKVEDKDPVAGSSGGKYGVGNELNANVGKTPEEEDTEEGKFHKDPLKDGLEMDKKDGEEEEEKDKEEKDKEDEKEKDKKKLEEEKEEGEDEEEKEDKKDSPEKDKESVKAERSPDDEDEKNQADEVEESAQFLQAVGAKVIEALIQTALSEGYTNLFKNHIFLTELAKRVIRIQREGDAMLEQVKEAKVFYPHEKLFDVSDLVVLESDNSYYVIDKFDNNKVYRVSEEHVQNVIQEGIRSNLSNLEEVKNKIKFKVGTRFL